MKQKNEYDEFADKFFELMDVTGRENGLLVNAIAKKWLTEHRTIQQGFGRMLKSLIDSYSVMSVGSDLRNQATIDWAKNSADYGNGGRFPYI